MHSGQHPRSLLHLHLSFPREMISNSWHLTSDGCTMSHSGTRTSKLAAASVLMSTAMTPRALAKDHRERWSSWERCCHTYRMSKFETLRRNSHMSWVDMPDRSEREAFVQFPIPEQLKDRPTHRDVEGMITKLENRLLKWMIATMLVLTAGTTAIILRFC